MELITDASSDTESSAVVSTGPIIVSVTGTFTTGIVRITGDIGAGEATALVITPATFKKLDVIGFPAGVTFKAYAEDIISSDSVTVAYINAIY